MVYLATFDEDSRIIRVKIVDTTSGAGKTGLTPTSDGLVISTIGSSEAISTVYTSAGGTIETITTLGTYTTPTDKMCRFKEVDAIHHPGLYEIQLDNARLSVAGSKYLVVTVFGVTGAAQVDVLINITRFDLQSATVTASSVTDKMGYTVSTVQDKTGYTLTQAFPANFANLAVTAGGAVTAGTVNDKTGYNLTQSFPANFANLAITAGGAITAGTVMDKTGYTASTVTDKTGYSLAITPPTAAEIDTQLTSSHGSGAWNTSGTGDAPTVEEIDAQLSLTHGSGAWDVSGGGDAPTVEEIDAQLSSTHGSGAWDVSGGGGDAPTVEEIDAQLSATHGAGRWATQGSGEIAYQYIVKDCVTRLPVDGVWVNVSTDEAGVNIIAQGVTNTFGQVVFWLDPGTYYMWSYRCGYYFPLPDTEIVPTP